MRRQLLVNGAIVALALGTLGVVWATRGEPTTAELASRKGKLLPRFAKAGIVRLEVTQGESQVVLEPARDAPGEFRIVKPWNERADVATVNRLLGALDLASWLRPADGVSSEAAGLGPSALKLRVETAEGVELVTLGGPAPSPRGGRYVEVALAGGSRRYVVSEGVADELSLTPDQLREPLLLEYGRSELHRIRIQNSGSRLDLEQRARGEFFVVTATGPELADRDGVDRILTALSRLSASRFLDPLTTPPSSFRRALRVEVQPHDAKEPKVTLTFGDECSADASRVALLREQAGKAPRMGCVPADVLPPLLIEASALRLSTLFSARTDEVEELRVKRGEQQYVLLRKESGFLLRTPAQQSITLDAGNERIGAILNTPGERPSTTDRVSLGLDRPDGELFVQVTASPDGSRREERALLGARRHDGSVCLERTLDHVALCFSAETAGRFEPDATLLRPLSLLSFAPSELETLTTVSANLRQTVSRQADGTYRLIEPAGFAHDGSLVSDAVQTLGTLGAVRWVSLTDAPRFELSRPRLTVRITFANDAPPRELSVGTTADAGYYARLSPDPAVFVLSRSAFADLSSPFIDRALSPFSGDDFQSATLKSKTGIVTDDGTSAAGEHSERTEALRSLKADRVLHLGKSLPHEGFGAPLLQITYRSKTQKQVEVLVGSCDTQDDLRFCYARRSDVDATFALPLKVAHDLQTSTSHDDHR